MTSYQIYTFFLDHERAQRTARGFVSLLVTSAICCGCMSSSTLETARVRPLGKAGFNAVTAISAGEGAMIRVTSRSTDEFTGETKEDIHGLPFVKQWAPEFGFRGYVGVGAGFEVMLGLESPMIFYGLGGVIGIKWQAPFEGPFSAALSFRAAGSTFNKFFECGENRCFSTGSLQGRLLMSYELAEYLVLTLTPQVANTWFSVGYKDSAEDFTGEALNFGGSLGFMWTETVDYHIELTVLYAPQQDGIPDGGRWLFIPAVGVGL